jgi:hypothetical protein
MFVKVRCHPTLFGHGSGERALFQPARFKPERLSHFYDAAPFRAQTLSFV